MDGPVVASLLGLVAKWNRLLKTFKKLRLFRK
jgi:hypothetical protein